jgi:hypothetical protein
VNIPLHVACGVARLLACAEAIVLLVGDGPRRLWAYVGIGIAAAGGFFAFIEARMQFNLNHPAVWRFFGVAWACAAIGLGMATASNWRCLSDLTPKWVRYHGAISGLYAVDKVVYHFTPLGYGQKVLWGVLWSLHWWVAVALFLAWLVLWVVGQPAPHRGRPNESDSYCPGKNFAHHTP